MLVTSSRLQAVKYKQELDKYLAEKGYTWKAAVAFSGTVTDEDTKAGLHGSGDERVPRERRRRRSSRPTRTGS